MKYIISKKISYKSLGIEDWFDSVIISSVYSKLSFKTYKIVSERFETFFETLAHFKAISNYNAKHKC